MTKQRKRQRRKGKDRDKQRADQANESDDEKTMQHVINSPLGKKKDDFGYHQNQPEQKKECKAS